MGIITPDFGLLFWMLVSFSAILFILKKFAWKPILKALAERENSIDEALKAAESAKEEMAKLQASNEKILKEAIQEREKIVKEARDLKDSIVREAKNLAAAEAAKMVENAKAAIEQEKAAAVNEIKAVIATFSIDIAEKILSEHLDNDAKQKELVKKYIDQITVN
jgi:F-type H+-transporting ATPase subunit b